MNLYVLSYNNYYNRIVKKEDSFGSYAPFVIYGPVQGVYGFTPGDGVNTTQVLGSNVQMYNGEGDYLIAITKEGEIDSRWFIIDTKRERSGQWTLTLHRDLVVDFYDQLLDSPVFIEKATLPNNSPLIFNKEQMTFNQIKKGEYKIENNLRTPWVVAYLSRKDGGGNYNRFNGSFVYERAPVTPTYTLNSLDDYDFSNWLDTPYLLTNDIDFKCYYYDPSGQPFYKYMKLSNPGSFYGIYGGGYIPGYENWPTKQSGVSVTCSQPVTVYNELLDVYNNYDTIDSNGVPYNSLTNIGTTNGFKLLSEEAGKTIKVGNTYYEITATVEIQGYSSARDVSITTDTTLYDAVFDKLVRPSGLAYNNSTILNAVLELPIEMTKITLSAKPLEAQKTVEYDFTYNKAVTTDAVYEIIATPLYTKTFEVTGGGSITSQGTFGLQWLQALAQDHSTKVYDVQIVPYIQVDTNNVSQYEYVTLHEQNDANNILALAIKLPSSSFNLLLETPSNARQIVKNSDTKIGSETELWRLTSPNGVGNFDFNPYKNNKQFEFIEVDCTLIPINPYIKINPLFDPNGLYGGDYNDYRGLICGGDFSVALTNSEWQTYQQQNKNFQAMFDRQIESMELNNKIGLGQDIASIVAGAGSGAAAGALAGSVIMPGIGTGVGAAIGGVLSAGAGVADVILNQKLRSDALDLTQDQFNYNLGNIQARANKLTKTTAFNINNKYFPYIEYFTCTDIEKQALANKIAYNGMTTMVIGKFRDYIHNNFEYNGIKDKGYIKGQLIRLEGTNDDYHVINSLANELYKGVYFTWD